MEQVTIYPGPEGVGIGVGEASLRDGWRRFLSPAWVILFAGVLTFALTIWLRTRGPSLSELEALIEANAPYESVQSLAVAPDGTVYVGTSMGLIAGAGGGGWKRVDGITSGVRAIGPVADGKLYLGGPDLGLSLWQGRQLQQLRQGDVAALAVDPGDEDRLVVYDPAIGFAESRDGGRTWATLSEVGDAEILAAAIDPADSGTIVAGGLDGFLAITTDGGRTWEFPVPLHATVSALGFDRTRPGRLWAAAGGQIFYSDDRARSWTPIRRKAGEHVVVALAPVDSGGQARILAVTPGGYLFSVSE